MLRFPQRLFVPTLYQCVNQTPESQEIRMPQSMKWDKWSGFQGDGTYVIFNKESLTCLHLENGSKEPDTKAQGLLVNEG
ncbi:MAG: hypothetical protein Q9192_004998 [Flavoplaca navasiana]